MLGRKFFRRLWVVGGLLLLNACVSPPVRHGMIDHPTVAAGAEAAVYETPDHVQLFGQWWNLSQPLAVVLIVHGTALHSGFYAPLAQHLQEAGYAVGAIDLRGWGQSGGFGHRRGYIGNYDEYVLDLEQLAADARQRYPGKQVYLLGESLGGAVVLLAQLEHAVPNNGLILSAPAVWANPGLFGWHAPHALMAPVMWSGKVIGETFPNLPLLPIWRPIVNQVFFDEEARERFMQDPNNTHTWLPASYVNGLYDAMLRIRYQTPQIQAPMLILQGTKDNLVPFDSSEFLCQNSSSQDKTLIRYDGMSHALLSDFGREAVWGDIVHWLTDHVQQKAVVTYNGCPWMVDALTPPHLHADWIHLPWSKTPSTSHPAASTSQE